MKTSDYLKFNECVRQTLKENSMNFKDVLSKHGFKMSSNFSHPVGGTMSIYKKTDHTNAPHFVYLKYRDNDHDEPGFSWSSSHPERFPTDKEKEENETPWENIPDAHPEGKGRTAKELDNHLGSIFYKTKN